MALVALVAALLVTLVWLAGRYEAGRLQDRIEHDAVDVGSDIRTGLARNVQNLQGLPPFDPDRPDQWVSRVNSIVHTHREMLRIELRDAQLQTRVIVNSDLRAAVFDDQARATHAQVQNGQFGAEMQVALVNDGPVTIPLRIDSAT